MLRGLPRVASSYSWRWNRSGSGCCLHAPAPPHRAQHWTWPTTPQCAPLTFGTCRTLLHTSNSYDRFMKEGLSSPPSYIKRSFVQLSHSPNAIQPDCELGQCDSCSPTASHLSLCSARRKSHKQPVRGLSPARRFGDWALPHFTNKLRALAGYITYWDHQQETGKV